MVAAVSGAVPASQAWVGAALDGGGAWSLRGRIPVLLGLMMLFDSWDAIVMAFTLPAISTEWQLAPDAAGLLVSAGYAGQFIGAILFGIWAERAGRLPVLRLLIIVMSVLAVACAMAASYGQLVAIRAIQGLAIGGAIPVAICYINEIAPTATRGKFFGTFQFLMLAGYGLAPLASNWIVAEHGWRPMYAIGAAPLLLVPFLWFIPESPRWLAGRGRQDEAGKALASLGSAASTMPADVTRGTVTETAKVPIAELFTRKRRGRSLVVAVLWFFTSLVVFGLVNWLPKIYIDFFSIPQQEALRYATFSAVAIFVLPLILRQIIDVVGRRPPVIIGTAIGGAALLGMLLVPDEAWMVVIGLLILGQIGVSVGSMILWPYTAEIHDTRVRATALGASSSLARGAAMLAPLLVGGVLALTGSPTIVFIIFGACSLGVAALWLFATRETAGRQMSA